MNKKYLNIGLIVLLILIWSSVIYKYFGGSNTVNNNQEVAHFNSNYSFNIIKDTFKLKLTNTNPFKASKKRTNSGKNLLSKQSTISRKGKSNKSDIWPNVKYFGFVKGEYSKSKLVLIKVNNKLYRKRENESIENLLIVKAYSDSLVISLNRNRKTIKIENE